MPITARGTARDEILLQFKTAWDAGTPPIPLLIYDDKHVDLPNNASYARITIQFTTAVQSTVGGRVSLGGGGQRFRRFGLITVQIFSISGDGLTVADPLVDLAVDAFEGTSTGSDRIEFRNVRATDIGQDGPWYQTNVVAEFEYDRVK